jgi:hypothetical protein
MPTEGIIKVKVNFDFKNMKKTIGERRQWTKDDIKKFVQLWDNCTVKEIESELGLRHNQLSYIRTKIKTAGYQLSRKNVRGVADSLIHEAMRELNISLANSKPTKKLSQATGLSSKKYGKSKVSKY